MSLILKILAVIGIILLVFLGILLLVLLLVLFAPFRYRIQAAREDPEVYDEYGDVPWLTGAQALVDVRWILGFIRVELGYPEDGKLRAKVGPFTVFTKTILGDSEEEEEEDETGADSTGTGSAEATAVPDPSVNETMETAPAETAATGSTTVTQSVSEEPEIYHAETATGEATLSDPGAEVRPQATTPTATPEEPTASASAPASPTQGTATAPEKPSAPDKIEALKAKLSDLAEKASHYREILEDPRTKRSLEKAIKAVQRILKALAPREGVITGRLGLAMPDQTGLLFGALGILDGAGLIKGQPEPEFGGICVHGKLRIRGRIFVCVLLWAALMVYFNRDVQWLIKRFKNKE